MNRNHVRLLLLLALMLVLLTGCGTVVAPGDTGTQGGPLALYSTNTTTATTLPITPWSGQAVRTVARVIVPVSAGQVLDMDGRARFTNDAPLPRYTVGISTALWGYDVDSGLGSAGPWWTLDHSTGDNVTPDRHHIPVTITGVYTVPADWPAGHRITVVLRSDAASTQARDGDAVTADDLTRLTVRVWPAAG